MLRGILKKQRAGGKDVRAKDKGKKKASETEKGRKCDMPNSTARDAGVDTGGCGRACMAFDGAAKLFNRGLNKLLIENGYEQAMPSR